jgi:hypothetical protein
MLPLLLSLVTPAHALAGLRLDVGAGADDQGYVAGRIGLVGDLWFTQHIGVGARVMGGTQEDGAVFLAEPSFDWRPIGGKVLGLVIEPGLGVAVLANSQAVGPVLSGSVFAGLQVHVLVLQVAVGPRFETYGFQQGATTLELGFGVAI